MALFAVSPFSLAADDSFYGITPDASVTLATDYMWRGVSQTNNEPAIQGSLDLNHESGLYAGVWASSYEFNNNATMELDAYAGFASDSDLFGVLPFTINYDLGFLRYEYTDTTDTNFTEFYIGASLSPVENLNTSVYYYYGLKLDRANVPGEYTDFAVDYTLPAKFGGITLLAHAGYYNQKRGKDNYWDWKAGASKDIGGFTIEVAYFDTDDSNSYSNGRRLDDGRIVASISRELGGNSSTAMLPKGVTASASVALTTDYVWRGVSQTNDNPAIQGSFDIAHDSGFYAGVWASSFEGGKLASSMELDIYSGYSGTINVKAFPHLTYDAGVLRYEYTGSSDLNFTEVYGGISVEPAKNVNASIYYYYGLNIEGTKPGAYLDIAVDYTLPKKFCDVKLLAHVGRYNQRSGNPSYWDWKIGAAKDIDFLLPLNVEVAYTDTDGTGAEGLDSASVVGTLSASF